MGSKNGFFSTQDFSIDAKWLIDPRQLFVGPKIGEGAHAKVYEGKYKNQTVAIKVVRRGETPEEIARREGRFAREVAMLSRVQHKNLVKFIGACKEPIMVIVTELLLGGTLRKYLLNMRPKCLDMRVVIGFALDIARAMECLHSHGVIHRDLKPLYSTVTLRHGEKKHYNHKVDAYSFAIVLWELIHNKLPFEGMSNLQAAYAAAFKDPYKLFPFAENLILTEDHKTVKLADFGLAREESLTEMMTAETGTYRWMAPEVSLPINDTISPTQNVRPSADDLPEDLALIVTSCWQEDPNARPNFSQIIQMLLRYLSIISPVEQVMPPKRTTSENAVLPPESPGTSSLMGARDGVGETPKATEENRARGFFCFNWCC
ncbi:hypothetical protein GOBAR_AA00104 [Gossypium barbadense]|uniref:Protein kinase domain-containing protein n=1 Tax=Gossypium barbadense TaxID=3634 RepID=A0A2P5YY16_GOSBA|nr:hypothetical protein GOBAR_AA00104 [Gossypium barbadense]